MSAVSGGAAVTTFNPSTNRVSNLPCASSITPFDAAGNQLCDTDSNGVVRQYGLDAESHTTQIAILGNTADPFETYTYDAGGSRSRKTNGTGTYTEYINFGGQTVAENNGDGTMSDYIFANGQRIARADDFDVRIHMSGTNCSGCSSTNTFAGTQSLTAANGMVIQNGDLLAWRQYQDGVAAGGISIGLGNGTTGTAGVLRAEDGQLTDDDTRTGSWYMRVANLNAYAGMTISSLNLYNNQGGAPGNWDIYLGDIVLVHANGTIVPLYDRTLSGLSPFSPGAAETNVSVITEDVLNSSKPATTSDITTTTYYVGDHLGSEQLLTGGGGWPLSSSQYMPFGAEIVPTSNPNHYKFTGKERDTESGNDYFGARYYASTMGRFMSPDWAAKAEPVPYSKLDDPQTLNLYSYVRNNPLSGVDPDGHYFVVSAAMQQQVQQYISTLLRTPQGAATVNAIASSNLPVSFGLGTLPAVSNGNGTMSITAGTTVPVPGSTPGAIGGASVTLDNANISTIANATGKSDFQTGLTAFTHEDQHVTDILGAKTLQGAAAAGAAGDAPSAPGANNTTGGTAEGRAQQIVGALGAAGQSFQPNAQYDGAAANILKQGAAQQQAAQQKAACTGGSCPQ
jgi:RHS repeat-associated protein